MLAGKYQQLHERLIPHIPEERLIHDDLRLLALGSDASFYRLVPRLIVRAHDEEDIRLLLRECQRLQTPLTFRAAGTSLSGQTITDSVLVMLDQGWKKTAVEDDGARIRCQSGVIGGVANQVLLPWGRKIGPDPGSLHSAMIGGIVANNASGMCCATEPSSYRTLAGLRIMLADGAVIDSGCAESVQAFRRSHGDFLRALSELRARTLADAALSRRIRRKYKLKNTTGYSLNALVDYEDPVDILQHLLVGSEGTLGFLSEITLNTLPEYAHKATALMIFADIGQACRAVALLKCAPVDAVELMDRAALRSVENKTGMPDYLPGLPPGAAALLVETRAPQADLLQRQVREILSALQSIPTHLPVSFTTDPVEYSRLWSIRKGLLTSVGAVRPKGTTVIIEDVAFPVPRLAQATLELQGLFRKHGYEDAIIFGHALEGNLHFVFSQNFNLPAEVERYRHFLDQVCHMVVTKYDGSLKAEHGTGRNMAPYVALEWGEEAVAIMQEIKKLFDPHQLLNPGVLLNDDPQIHLKNLKPLPAAHELVDTCIECGFCEPHCVSNGLTLSARQRIVAFREIERLAASAEDLERLDRLTEAFTYYGDETCATDGLCALACPVEIDTGKLIKELRCRVAPRFARRVAGFLAAHMALVTAGARLGLNVVNAAHTVLHTALLGEIAGGLRKLSGGLIPQWTPHMPRGSRRIRIRAPQASSDAPQVVYFPSCITRAMGPAKGEPEDVDLPRLTERLLHKAGFEIVYPQPLNALCCGMAFASKGYKEAGDRKAAELNDALWAASEQGRLPVLADMSPCLYRMKETLDKRIHLYEPIAFTLAYLAPRLQFTQQEEPILLHTVCSAKKMGLEEAFLKLALLCAKNVVMADNNCCGFAGDRGFTYPELNAHGLRSLRAQVPQGCREGYSTSRTCEIGLSEYSGVPFRSILYLVERCTSRKSRCD